MADPICRWRNSSIKQLIEFNSIFPLLPTEKSQGRDYVEKNWKLFGGNNFFTTPYQLAAQILQNELYGTTNITLEDGRTTLIDIYNGTCSDATLGSEIFKCSGSFCYGYEFAEFYDINMFV